jgi:hypothetical protein
VISKTFINLGKQENRKNLFKDVYFWNKIENRINHRFAAIYNMLKKYNANKSEIFKHNG